MGIKRPESGEVHLYFAEPKTIECIEGGLGCHCFFSHLISASV